MTHWLRVKLKLHELEMAGTVGLHRAVRKLGSTTHNYIGNKGYGYHTHIMAAQAECAFAKAFNLYWDGSEGTYGAPDVAGCQIRHTPYASGGLILRPHDLPKRAQRFYLVIGEAHDWAITGWMWGHEVMPNNGTKTGPFWLDVESGCWKVPQTAEALHDPLDGAEELRAWDLANLALPASA